jgi:hypothetical protein
MRLSLRVSTIVLALMGGTLFSAVTALAQTDEIQVYDASIADQGKFNLMLHNNYTPRGHTSPAFPGGIVQDRAYNGVAEWAYGVAPWFEQGLYLPLYSISQGRGGSVNGFKLRELFVRPHADDRTFFYGVNFEFSVNALYWESRRITSEIRPIIGWHFHPIDLIVNPIMDTNYTGGFKGLDFAPSERLAYNFPRSWAIAAEEYADYGPLRQFNRGDDQYHMLYAVVDHNSKIVNVEFGVGFGLTPGTDKVTIKLMLSRDLN